MVSTLSWSFPSILPWVLMFYNLVQWISFRHLNVNLRVLLDYIYCNNHMTRKLLMTLKHEVLVDEDAPNFWILKSFVQYYEENSYGVGSFISVVWRWSIDHKVAKLWGGPGTKGSMLVWTILSSINLPKFVSCVWTMKGILSCLSFISSFRVMIVPSPSRGA